jgi:hypothetical protein
MRGSFVRKGLYHLEASVLDDGSAEMVAHGDDEGMSKTFGVAATAAATAVAGPVGGLATGGVVSGALDGAVDAVIGLLPGKSSDASPALPTEEEGLGKSRIEEVVEDAAAAQAERMKVRRARPGSKGSRPAKEASTK